MIPLHRRLAWLGREQTADIAIADAGGPMTFAGAAALSARMASALAASGLGPGDRFLLLSANRREGLVAYFAASASGAVCTQLNNRLSEDELAEIAADAAPVLALADADGARKLLARDPGFPVICLDGACPGAAAFDAWLAAADGQTVPDRDSLPGDPLFQLYTSGTTGRPSGIVLSQHAWAAQIEQFGITQPYGPGDGVLVVTPLFHIAATITATAALLSGARIELPARFDADAVLTMLNDGVVAGTMMVPAMIDMVVAAAARRGLTAVRGVRRICYGASPIAEGSLRRALDLFGCDFLQGYGLTETAGVATVLMPADHRRALAGHADLLRSAGRPVMGCEVRVADADGRIVAAGERGEIQIRGPNLFSGYFRNAERTAAAWTGDGWFRTGDAGHIDGEGYVFIIDRIKDLVITGGENVFPQEVERVLATHPAVVEVSVYGVADGQWGEAVAAALILKPGAAFDEDEMRGFVGARLARFKTPRHYRLYDELPRNATGKVLRKSLAAMHAAGIGSTTTA